ncbi:SRPBCC family protein [Egicoccus halophilus]|uniref:Polyketide cyclase / dehydrase and lipid transport n=1 Tax=Egicoccus halophilus TaxID=1670830 RepID=A0A8J3EUH4_9ACTN|nr:SRPBCC family protein [Egicoccus halophilus]GGI07726.1 hypothetical protein GCM10011354_25530 [Egicoccus halophilus]
MAAIDLAGTWRTTAPRDDVWVVVADLSTWPKWWPAIDEVELLAGTPSLPESALLTFGTPIRPLRVEVAVAVADNGERLDVVTVDGPVHGTGRLELTEEADGTAVRFALRLDVRSRLFKPVERVLSGAGRGGRERLRQAGDDLARLAGGEPGRHEV